MCRLPTINRSLGRRTVFLFPWAGRPGSSEVPRNPLTRWDVSSIPANGIFLTQKLKNKIKMPNGWRRIKSLLHKIRLHSRRGKGMAESFSREKWTPAPQKEGGWEILCNFPPVWSRLVRPTNLMSRMNGKKTHTHTWAASLSQLPAIGYWSMIDFLFERIIGLLRLSLNACHDFTLRSR